MSWLRRQQDIASLFAVWALLFQVLLGPFAMAGHAFGATSLGGIICTTRGQIDGLGTLLPKQPRHNDDCGVGCSHACRTACGMNPVAASDAVGFESSRASCLTDWRDDDSAIRVIPQSESCSRAPPA